MDPDHLLRVEGRIVTCSCGYSVAFPDNVERAVAAEVARRHLATMRAPLIKRVIRKKAAD